MTNGPVTQDTGSPELDFSDPSADDFEALARDRVPVRSMTAEDLDAIVAIDRHLTGRNRREYLAARMDEALNQSGLRVSLIAEEDKDVAGFIMARVDFGEFGRTVPEAVIDTIGVDPAHEGHHVGAALLSQLMVNLGGLRVERVHTEVDWSEDLNLLGFLAHSGFVPAQRLAFRKPIA